MQKLSAYIIASDTLGKCVDYAAAQSATFGKFIFGVSAELKLKLYAHADSQETIPLTTFADVSAWQFVVDNDYSTSTTPLIVADPDGIEVASEEDAQTGNTLTTVTIPCPNMASERLATTIAGKETIDNLIGELIGFDADSEAVFVLQIKGLSVRNRVAGPTPPPEQIELYYTKAQTDLAIQAAVQAAIAQVNSNLDTLNGENI